MKDNRLLSNAIHLPVVRDFKISFELMLINKKKTAGNYYGARYFIYLLLLGSSWPACNQFHAEKKSERAFYYWKSVVSVTSFELKQLDSLHVKTIYLKLFDVNWQASAGHPVPVARLQVPDRDFFPKYHIIPTVFIANECIQKADSAQTILLAGKIYGLIKTICEMYHIGNIDEIQVDCDWTAATSKKYFSLLRSIRQLSNTGISATIRFPQIKFVSETGVPPVDRGMLMCYNMDTLKNPSAKNSIPETNELNKYTGNLSSYPLPLDIALPLFEWQELFRNNIYKGLIENIPAGNFSNSFSLVNDQWIEITKDTLLRGYDFKKGDILRTEESNAAEIIATASAVNKSLKNAPGRISLFYLDSLTLSKFAPNEMESMYHIFR